MKVFDKFFLPLNIYDFSLLFMQKLHPKQKEGDNMLGALELLTGFRQEDHNSFLFFIYYLPYFSYGEITTVLFKGSWFEFHQWARLDWEVGPSLLMRLLVAFTLEI